MRITPNDIQNKQFKTRYINGFDIDEVSNFMEAIREEMEELLKENDRLRNQLNIKDSQLIEYKKIDALMRETLLVMQRTAEEYEANARAQAEAIILEAQQRAQKMLLEKKEEINKLREEINEMKSAKRHFNDEFIRYLESQRRIIDMHDEEELEEGEIMINQQQ